MTDEPPPEVVPRVVTLPHPGMRPGLKGKRPTSPNVMHVIPNPADPGAPFTIEVRSTDPTEHLEVRGYDGPIVRLAPGESARFQASVTLEPGASPKVVWSRLPA